MKNECMAIILAGGNGTRLGTLTDYIAKPMVHFGGKYRIIDFTLSNCAHSGVDILGVLTQYRASGLHRYIGNGRPWKLDKADGGVYMLPSYATGSPYTGTANAVYQNIEFIEQFNPEHILILSGDHIYKMDYGKMLDFHKETGADATISVVPVPWEEASRFGVMSTAGDGKITGFAEKPDKPKSNLASMGIYLFKWSRLKQYLLNDQESNFSDHDFGKNIIPKALTYGEKLYAYRFGGYWRDVGTVQSLWESNMDLLVRSPDIDLCEKNWEIFAKDELVSSRSASGKASIRNSIIHETCDVQGKVKNSVLCGHVNVDEDAEIVDSILMPGVSIGKNAKIYKSVVGFRATIKENVIIGADDGLNIFYDDSICSKDISLIGPGVNVGVNLKIKKNSYIDKGSLWQAAYAPVKNASVAELKLAHA